MSSLEGGLRDRMIIESFFRMLRASLTALGWFAPNRAHAPINMVAGPMPRNEEIPPNTLVVSFEDIDSIDMEMGSNAAELTHVIYIDFYAEPPPPTGMGGEALGKHVIGDIRSIIAGELPSIGRDKAVLEVFDYSLATPVSIFFIEFDRDHTKAAKVHRYDQPWERWWYTCVTEGIEERD